MRPIHPPLTAPHSSTCLLAAPTLGLTYADLTVVNDNYRAYWSCFVPTLRMKTKGNKDNNDRHEWTHTIIPGRVSTLTDDSTSARIIMIA